MASIGDKVSITINTPIEQASGSGPRIVSGKVIRVHDKLVDVIDVEADGTIYERITHGDSDMAHSGITWTE